MKKFLLVASITLIPSLLFVVSLVYGKSLVSSSDIEIVDVFSKNIYLESKDLNSTIIRFKSLSNLSDYKLESSCKIDSKYIGAKEGISYFQIKFISDICANPNILLVNSESIFSDTLNRLNILSKGKLYNMYTDFPSDTLKKLNTKLSENIKKYSIYKSYKKSTEGDYYDLLKKNRTYKELVYQQEIITEILESRNSKYTIPIEGKEISTHPSKIPNAGRPYRESYTDGVHHGWDIGDSLGETVVSIDNGVIIRVVSNFEYSDLQKLKYGDNLSEEQKLRNLDILRGNQVWLKTSKGDVVFYSHLSNIAENIKEKAIVGKGAIIGTSGISGVPDKNYKDFHLHFAIHKNPYNIKRAGKYDIEDIMKWDWYLKGQNKEDVLANQSKIFEN